MMSSMERRLQRALEQVESQFDAASLERVGRCVVEFTEAERRGEAGLHPEAFVVELPVRDHDLARSCFETLELLRELKSSEL